MHRFLLLRYLDPSNVYGREQILFENLLNGKESGVIDGNSGVGRYGLAQVPGLDRPPTLNSEIRPFEYVLLIVIGQQIF
jgi:hypothetical protein